MAPDLFWLVVGFTGLIVGGDLLVRGASGIAVAMKVPSLVIGLTIVAFGTSAPEFAVTASSSLSGQTDLAMGNVLGSCIFNVLFILGISALVAPLVVSARLVWLEVPLIVGSVVALLLMSMDGTLGRVEGGLLFASLLIYTGWLLIQSRKEPTKIQDEFTDISPEIRTAKLPREILIDVGLLLAGLALLVFGSNCTVQASTSIARQFGISELIIGLTIVSVGTSLPEVVTSVMASVRGERDIAVGNVVGSNLFNVLGVGGLAALVSPDGIAVSQDALNFDIPVTIAVSVACLPIFFTHHIIARWEGGLLFAYYLGYTAYLILTAIDSDLVRSFKFAMWVFAIPLTCVTLAVGVVRGIGDRKSRRSSDV